MNITYLLGAGASYNALPVIDELPDRLLVFYNTVNAVSYGYERRNELNEEQLKLANNLDLLKADIRWLLEEVQAHKTVDTLAKKFYVVLEHHPLLVKLKKVLICYFLFEQIAITNQDSARIRSVSDYLGNVVSKTKETPDKRYDSFVATIINKERGNLNLAPNFKVVTWNYDVQFELAYKRYLPSPTTEEIKSRLQTLPSLDFFNGKKMNDLTKFSITRLNGVAGLFSLPLALELKKNDKQQVKSSDLVIFLAELNAEQETEDVPAFSYAWEEHSQLHTVHPNKGLLFKTAKEVMSQTEILVVIGYSFPNFNRSVDKMLLSEMKKLKKVYVQDVNAEEVCELVKSSFELPQWNLNVLGGNYYMNEFGAKVPVIPVKGVDQFFIPPEAEI